jgi:2-polyprenyl-3-methyl-5-hydroxy-6-metoxy-1,4-benzoquinol methylase
MRYRLAGREIRTENAAQPSSRAARWILGIIASLPRRAVALDYGCGRLRYTVALAKRAHVVHAVDSAVQLTRRQVIHGRLTSVADFARAIDNIRVHDVSSAAWRRLRYEFILCANVLSAIPSHAARSRVLRSLRAALAPHGRLLAVTQYTNSSFTAYASDRRAEKFLDGYLIRSARGTFFYGVIPPAPLAGMCRKAGLHVLAAGRVGQAAYAVCARAGLTRVSGAEGRPNNEMHLTRSAMARLRGPRR